MRTRIKICCISSREEAILAISAGADALGLVGPMPSGPGVITDDEIAEITASIPPPIASFLLTSETDAAAIIRHQQKVNTSTVQIVDSLASGSYREIRKALPFVKLVQVIHVVDQSSVDEALQLAAEPGCGSACRHGPLPAAAAGGNRRPLRRGKGPLKSCPSGVILSSPSAPGKFLHLQPHAEAPPRPHTTRFLTLP